MPGWVLAAALVWSVALLAGSIGAVIRARTAMERAVAADLLVLVLVAVLAEIAYLRETAYYLDAALVLAALAFVGTVAIARFHARGKVL